MGHAVDGCYVVAAGSAAWTAALTSAHPASFAHTTAGAPWARISICVTSAAAIGFANK